MSDERTHLRTMTDGGEAQRMDFRGLVVTYLANVVKVAVWGTVGILALILLAIAIAFPMAVGYYVKREALLTDPATTFDYAIMGAQFVWFAFVFAAMKTADEWGKGDE